MSNVERSSCIQLNTLPAVTQFVELTTRFNGDVTLRQGKYVVNGKSVIGVFCLDLLNEFTCTLEGTKEDCEELENKFTEMGVLKWIAL